jgi:MFS family permease
MIHFAGIATLPLYAKAIGGNNFTMGLVTSVYFIAALLFRPLTGKILDQKGRKIVLIMGLTLVFASVFASRWADSINIFMMLRFVNGIGYSIATTAAGTIVADLVPSLRLAEGIGYYSISLTIGVAAGPALGLGLINHFGYPGLFFTIAGIAFLALISALFIDYEKKQTDTQGVSKAALDVKGSFIEKTAVPLALVMMFTSLGTSGIMTFLPAYGLERNISNVSVFFLVYAVAMLFPRLFIGRMVDRYGGEKVVLPSTAMVVACLLLLAFGHSNYSILASAFCFGIGYGALQPTLNSMVIRVAPDNKKGAANATFFLFLDIGVCLGTAVWGYISNMTGFGAVYCSAAVLAAISFLFFSVASKGEAAKGAFISRNN